MERALQGPPPPALPQAPRASATQRHPQDRPDPASAAFACDLARRLAAGHYQVPLAAICSPHRRSNLAARARHVAIYLAHVTLGRPLRAVAQEFRRDRSSVAYACRRIEDLRDRPAFDAALSRLELTVQVLVELAREAEQ
jgi:hypothetical protein